MKMNDTIIKDLSRIEDNLDALKRTITKLSDSVNRYVGSNIRYIVWNNDNIYCVSEVGTGDIVLEAIDITNPYRIGKTIFRLSTSYELDELIKVLPKEVDIASVYDEINILSFSVIEDMLKIDKESVYESLTDMIKHCTEFDPQ